MRTWQNAVMTGSTAARRYDRSAVSHRHRLHRTLTNLERAMQRMPWNRRLEAADDLDLPKRCAGRTPATAGLPHARQRGNDACCGWRNSR